MSELQASGTRTQCDIFVGIEITNAEILLKDNKDLFADLSDYDTSNYVDEVLAYQNDVTLADGSTRKGHKKFHIQDKEAGCIVYSKSLVGDEVPTSYNDLLNPKYKGKIIMPNPKSSGTGYYFYNGMASLVGKDAALTYFTSLNDIKGKQKKGVVYSSKRCNWPFISSATSLCDFSASSSASADGSLPLAPCEPSPSCGDGVGCLVGSSSSMLATCSVVRRLPLALKLLTPTNSSTSISSGSWKSSCPPKVIRMRG